MPAYITSIATANPPHVFEQSTIAEFMALACQLNENETRKLKALYRSTKIQQRHSVLKDYGQTNDFEFYANTPDLEPFPSVSQRMEAYQKYALPLALEAISALDNCSDITHLITVSCTGLYAPGLDIELVEALSLKRTIHRTAINFMGCYGAFNGLKVADSIVRANSNAKVLMVSIELCTLHFQKKKDDNNLLSNALFADGVAALLVEAKPSGQCLEMVGFHCELLPEGKNEMAWKIAEFGFEMVLSSYVPKLVKGGVFKLISELKENLSIHSIDYFAIHPGGKAILEAVESALDITKEDNRFAYQVLRDYGNMSSATFLFVLQKILLSINDNDSDKHILGMAFGPGLTLESAIFKIQ